MYNSKVGLTRKKDKEFKPLEGDGVMEDRALAGTLPSITPPKDSAY